ncbi:SDR family oxidoreductase [Agaribacter marinus]|uniref:NAD-dependent dehydratase n=1 Tax=Agaribacter marinus TaxID=1431249 RepID=A0AA37WK86_9ALTE|nr:SDR family oxidoreductase [Agaribacter marinus]GLR70760.1 NAD-dependent dehydratase [Agaribacter marinus]
MNINKKVALVVGDQGVIGKNLVKHLLSLPDWEIVGLSRREANEHPRIRHIAVDLLNHGDSVKKLSGLTHITHIFYAAFQDRPTWSELVAPNLTMLVNVVEIIEKSSRNLKHVSLMQGYKVYGAHLGPFKTPAKESDPNHMPPEFNIDQQNFLEHKQAGKAWGWSAIRPSVVCGFSVGSPMNLAMVIAIYASITKELDLPLRFPGKATAYHNLLEMTDASLLAKATVWAATDEKCENQAFNISNGDLFRWDDLWPKIANYFDLDVAPPLQMSLNTVMNDKDNVWENMVKKYDLHYSYDQVSSWGFGDAVFSWDYDFIADGTKARRLGFHEFIETESMFFDIFDSFRNKKVIP